MSEILNQARIAHRAGRLAEAEQMYLELLADQPENSEILRLLGTVKAQLGDFEKAEGFLTRAATLSPQDPGAHFNLALVYLSTARSSEALARSEQALSLAPHYPAARSARAKALLDLKRSEEALAEYDRLLTLAPGDPGALHGRGLALMALVRPGEALESFNEALRGKASAAALGGRAVALQTLGRSAEAATAFRDAIALEPQNAPLHQGLADTLMASGENRDALAAYDQAYALAPLLPRLAGNRHYMKLKFCDWRDYELDRDAILAAVDQGVLAASTLITMESSPAQQQACVRLQANLLRTSAPPLWNGEKYAHGRIRIAYVSKDFHDHPNITLATELFERHDRSAFEVFAFSMGPDDGSVARRRLEAAFEHFLPIPLMSEREIATLIRRFEIDIVVDLDVYSTNSKPRIYAHRPAPVSVNYLGYPGTSGSPDMDYIIADRTIVPESETQFFDEHVVYMPDSYQANTRRPIAEDGITRAEAGLPANGFVFCCFNASQKIVPPTFNVWMRLLQKVDGSVLWLYGSDTTMQENLRSEAKKRGVDAMRLVFAARLPHDRHLARHRLADLFLDTLPFNAHTTASDALWAGLPVLTCEGNSFAGRVAASLLKAIRLDDMITHSAEEYEALALTLAREPGRLASIRERLARNRETTPLFDGQAYAAALESAYRIMWQRRQDDLPPEGFSV